jgi:ABC-type multidrug transport system ATPase subunit
MIRTIDLTKKYGSFVAVNAVNLSIPRGEIYGLIGPNGAGKTTTMMMLLGITRPSSGDIYLFGERATPDRLDLRRRIGVVPERHPRGVWDWMTAGEYLHLFADMFRLERAGTRIDHLLDVVGLSHVRGTRIREFSHGMLQKLSFIRALLPDPDLLVLDEPISGLDPLGVKQVRGLILSENREGRTIVMSSHVLSEMERICNRVAIVSQGRLVAEEKMEDLLSRVAQDRELLIELDRVPPGLEERLRAALPFVLGCATAGSQVRVRIPKDGDFRKPVSEYLFSQQLVPLTIQERAQSLEDAFVAVTQENIALFAAKEHGT